MPRWSRSNPLALAVLVCLYEKPMHPYEVAQTLRPAGQAGERPPQLRLSLRRGRVAREEGLHQGHRHRPGGQAAPSGRSTQITDDGRGEMNDWMTELIGVPAKEYPAFMAGLSFLPARSTPTTPSLALRAPRRDC